MKNAIDIWAFNWKANNGMIRPLSFSESFNEANEHRTTLPDGDYDGSDLMWVPSGIILKSDFKSLDPKQIRNLF